MSGKCLVVWRNSQLENYEEFFRQSVLNLVVFKFSQFAISTFEYRGNEKVYFHIRVANANNTNNK